MPRAVKGVLIQCDPAIRSLILKLDAKDHEYIIDDLDEQTLVVKEAMLADLRAKLDLELRETQQVEAAESESE